MLNFYLMGFLQFYKLSIPKIKDIPTNVVSNSIIQFINKFVLAALAIVDSIIIIRFIGSTVFDEFSVVMSYVMILMIFTDLGINTMVLKEYSSRTDFLSTYFVKVFFLHFILSSAVSVIGVIGLSFTNYDANIKVAILLALLIVIISSFTRAFLVVVQYLLKFEAQAISQILGKIFTTTFIAIFIIFTSTADLNHIVFATLVGSAASAVILYLLLPVKIELHDMFNSGNFIKHVLHLSLPYSSTLLVNALMVQQDKFILSLMSTNREVGIYSIGYRIFDFILVIPAYFMNSLYPVLLRSRDINNHYFYMIKKSVIMLLVLSILIIGVGYFSSEYIITNIWGSDFTRSVDVFNILLFGTPLFFLTAPLQTYLIVENKVKSLPYIYGAGLLINLIANILVIPTYKGTGAAIVTIITELLILVLLSVQVYRSQKLTK